MTVPQKQVAFMRMELMVYLLITLAYVASGKLGLLLALPPGYASPIFPPAGIAVAAAFIGGRYTLPWIFLGSLLLNVWVAYTGHQELDLMGFVAAVVIAAASTVQGALGGWGLRRVLGYPVSLSQSRELSAYLVLSPIICLTSASLSVTGLWSLGVIDSAVFGANWVSWWIGDTLGVLLVFPLVLIVAGGTGATLRGQILSVAVPMLLVVLGGFIAIYFLQNAAFNTARQRQQDNFEYQASEVALRMEQRLEAYEQVLRGVRGLFAASRSVERAEFRDYFRTLNLAKNYPGIQGVGFAQFIPREGLAAHMAAIRKEGFGDYSVYPVGERSFYTSVIYLEPFSGRNLRAFGFDMYSEAVRRAAMDEARDQERAFMSGKVTLVQETGRDVQSGFLVYLPVYRNGAHLGTVEERRANIAGWVYAAFRMDDLMRGILGDRVHHFGLEIYDGKTSEPLSLMYDSTPDGVGVPIFNRSTEIQTLGRAWTVNIHSLPAFESAIDTGRVNAVRTSGVLMTLLLSLLVWQLASGRGRALQLAWNMTRELRESQKQLNEAQRMARIGSWELDLASNVQTWSDEMYSIFEMEPVSNVPRYESFLHAIHPDDWVLVDEAYAESVRTRVPYSIEHRLLFVDGRVKFVRHKGETLYDEHGVACRTIGTVQDITEQKATQERIEHMAHYDTLTNLPNRAMFYDRLHQALLLAKRNEAGLTLLYMDLDGFKQVNDTLGHQAGDLLLRQVAERLAWCVRESDTVSRLGGDEFTIILAGTHKREDVEEVAGKIVETVSAPFNLNGVEVHIGISIGVARYTEDARSEDDLVQQADAAMYRAKAAGKNTYCVGVFGG